MHLEQQLRDLRASFAATLAAAFTRDLPRVLARTTEFNEDELTDRPGAHARVPVWFNE